MFEAEVKKLGLSSLELARIVCFETPQTLKIKQLSVSITNSRVLGYVLKKSIKTSPFVNSNCSGIFCILIIRDEEDTCAVYCWDEDIINKALEIQVGQFISIEFPDIRLRKERSFPTTAPVSLHLGERNKKGREGSTRFAKPSINLEKKCVDISLSLSSGKQTALISDIRTARVPIGSLCNILGYVLKVSYPYQFSCSEEKTTLYQSLRCVDMSCREESDAITISAWGDNCAMLDLVNVGDVVLFENVKVSQWKQNYQVIATWCSLVYVNPAVPELSNLKSWSPVKVTRNVEIPVKKMKLTTDFHKPVENEAFRSICSKPMTIRRNPASCLLLSKNLDASPKFTLKDKYASLIDAHWMKIGECACVIAMISEFDAHSRTVLICSHCERVLEKCFCSFKFQNSTWKFEFKISIIDHSYFIEQVELNDSDVTKLLGISASLFVKMQKDESDALLRRQLWNRCRIKILKTSEFSYRAVGLEVMDFKLKLEE